MCLLILFECIREGVPYTIYIRIRMPYLKGNQTKRLMDAAVSVYNYRYCN